MFNFSEFVKKGLIKAVGYMADYQIILNAAGWFEKGVLTETDLADIQAAIEAQATAQVEEPTESVVEEITEETEETGEAVEETTEENNEIIS